MVLNNSKYHIKDNIHIQINKVKYNAPHTHDFIEFVYMLSGKSLHKINGKEYPLSAGDLLIINYDQTHSFSGDPDASYCNILIKPAFIDKSMEECKDLFLLLNAAPYKKYSGVTFSEYLKRVRIENACRLICDEQLKINSVYPMVGYTNKTNFYKHFKELTGMTPHEYKK